MHCENLLNKLAYKCCKGECGGCGNDCKDLEKELDYLGNITLNCVFYTRIVSCVKYKIGTCVPLTVQELKYLRQIVQLEIADIPDIDLLSYHISVTVKQTATCLTIKVKFHHCINDYGQAKLDNAVEKYNQYILDNGGFKFDKIAYFMIQTGKPERIPDYTAKINCYTYFDYVLKAPCYTNESLVNQDCCPGWNNCGQAIPASQHTQQEPTITQKEPTITQKEVTQEEPTVISSKVAKSFVLSNQKNNIDVLTEEGTNTDINDELENIHIKRQEKIVSQKPKTQSRPKYIMMEQQPSEPFQPIMPPIVPPVVPPVVPPSGPNQPNQPSQGSNFYISNTFQTDNREFSSIRDRLRALLEITNDEE